MSIEQFGFLWIGISFICFNVALVYLAIVGAKTTQRRITKGIEAEAKEREFERIIR